MKLTKNSLFSASALSITVFILAVTGTYLFTDIPDKIIMSFTKDKGVATIVSKVQTVKIKREDELSWQDARQGSPLKNGQQVLTGPKSTALIRFKTKSELKLEENSLIRIGEARDRTHIELYSGLMEMNLNTTDAASGDYTIKAGGKVLSATGKALVAQISSDKEGAQIFVKEGNLNVKTQKGEVVAKKNDTISLNSQAQPTVQASSFILEAPENLAKLFLRKSEELSFKWQASGKSPNGILQIATSIDFKNSVIKEENVTGAQVSIKTLAPGNYFWRIVSTDKKTKSSTSSFSLYSIDAPTLKAPLDQVFIGWTDKIDFSWEPMIDVKEYQLQISKDNAVVSDIKIPEATYTLGNMTDGHYSWKVRAVYAPEQKEGDWSETRQLDFVKNPKVNLLAPENKSTSEITNISQTQITFKWDYPKNDAYTLTIGKNENLQETVLSKEIKDSKEITLKLEDLKSISSLYWKVCTVKVCSDVSSFTLSLPQIKNQKPSDSSSLELWKKNNKVTFTWDDIRSALAGHQPEYEIQIAKDTEFKNVVSSNTIKQNKFSWQAPNLGDYFWRVRLTGKWNGQNIQSGYSPALKFNLKKTTPLPPAIKAPHELKFKFKAKKSAERNPSSIEATQANINQEKIEESITYKIELDHTIEKARVRNYVVEIYKDFALTDKLLSMTLDTPEFKWDAPIQGEFFMRIALIDHWNQMGSFSHPIKVFVEKIPIPMDHVNLRQPEVGAVIKYAKDEDKQITFAWDNAPEAKEYILKIKEQGADGLKTIFERPTSTNEISISTRELNINGNYYWQITAIPNDNTDYYNGISKTRSIRFEQGKKTKEQNKTFEGFKNNYALGVGFNNHAIYSDANGNTGLFDSPLSLSLLFDIDNLRLTPGALKKFPVRFSTNLAMGKPYSEAAVAVEYSFYERIFFEKFENRFISPYFTFGYEQMDYCVVPTTTLLPTAYTMKALNVGAGILLRPLQKRPLQFTLSFLRPMSAKTDNSEQNINANGYFLKMSARHQFMKKYYGDLFYDKIQIDGQNFYGHKMGFNIGRFF